MLPHVLSWRSLRLSLPAWALPLQPREDYGAQLTRHPTHTCLTRLQGLMSVPGLCATWCRAGLPQAAGLLGAECLLDANHDLLHVLVQLAYNKQRRYWVLMFHLDTPDFEVPAVGVATADSITGGSLSIWACQAVVGLGESSLNRWQDSVVALRALAWGRAAQCPGLRPTAWAVAMGPSAAQGRTPGDTISSLTTTPGQAGCPALPVGLTLIQCMPEGMCCLVPGHVLLAHALGTSTRPPPAHPHPLLTLLRVGPPCSYDMTLYVDEELGEAYLVRSCPVSQ